MVGPGGSWLVILMMPHVKDPGGSFEQTLWVQMVDPGKFQSWILVDPSGGSWWILVVDPSSGSL